MKNIFYFVFVVLFIASCTKSGSDSGASAGQGGSMARFAISGDVLFAVTTDSLKVISIEDAANPIYSAQRNLKIGFDIETVFPMDTLLFIGSRNGMSVYDIRDPRFPTFLSQVSHLRSCDPVVAQDNYAYVTLNTISINCGRTPNNVLEVYDISNPQNPVLKRTIQMNGPTGLGVDGTKLFVCDKGLKVFDITDPLIPRQIDDLVDIKEVDVREAYDVIPVKELKLLILVATEGLFQFDYSSDKLRFVSKIEIKQQ